MRRWRLRSPWASCRHRADRRLRRCGAPSGDAGDGSRRRAGELEGQIGTLLKAQSEMAGRMQAMSELIGGRQAELSKSLSERLDGMTHRLNQSMGESTQEHARQPEAAARAARGARFRAGEHLDARRPGDDAFQHPRQQADARRLRAGAHGGDRRRQSADRRLRLPVHAEIRRAAQTASSICRTKRRRSSSTQNFRSRPITR